MDRPAPDEASPPAPPEGALEGERISVGPGADVLATLCLALLLFAGAYALFDDPWVGMGVGWLLGGALAPALVSAALAWAKVGGGARAERELLEGTVASLRNAHASGGQACCRGRVRVVRPVESPLERRVCAAFVARLPLTRVVARRVMRTGALEVETDEGERVRLEEGPWRIHDPFGRRVARAEAWIEDGDRVLARGRPRERAAEASRSAYRSEPASTLVLTSEGGGCLMPEGARYPDTRSVAVTARWSRAGWSFSMATLALGGAFALTAITPPSDPFLWDEALVEINDTPVEIDDTPVEFGDVDDLPVRGLREPCGPTIGACGAGAWCQRGDEGDVPRCIPVCEGAECPPGQVCVDRGGLPACVAPVAEGAHCDRDVPCTEGHDCFIELRRLDWVQSFCWRVCRHDAECAEGQWCVYGVAHGARSLLHCRRVDTLSPVDRELVEEERRQRSARGERLEPLPPP